MNRRDFLKTSLTAAAAAAGSVFLGGALLNVAAAPAERKGQGGKMKGSVTTNG